MNTPLDKPIHRTNINLFAEDVEEMKKMYGVGWTTRVRDMVHAHVKMKAKNTTFDPAPYIIDSGATDE